MTRKPARPPMDRLLSNQFWPIAAVHQLQLWTRSVTHESGPVTSFTVGYKNSCKILSPCQDWIQNSKLPADPLGRRDALSAAHAAINQTYLRGKAIFLLSCSPLPPHTLSSAGLLVFGHFRNARLLRAFLFLHHSAFG